MDNETPRISSSAMLREAEDRMRSFDVEELAVMEDNEVIGVITAQDIARAAAAGANPGTTPVKYATAAAVAATEEIRESVRRRT